MSGLKKLSVEKSFNTSINSAPTLAKRTGSFGGIVGNSATMLLNLVTKSLYSLNFTVGNASTKLTMGASKNLSSFLCNFFTWSKFSCVNPVLNLKSLININVNFNQVGSDRLTNAISLLNQKDNFIILDFGTATTFDVVIKKTYKGGIIAPGIRISLNTLSDKAALIPKINLKKINKIIGNDTISAVRSGFFWGYSGLIDNIVNLIKKETSKSFKLIITGGFSSLFKSSIKTKVILDKNITIKGLIKISKLIK